MLLKFYAFMPKNVPLSILGAINNNNMKQTLKVGGIPGTVLVLTAHLLLFLK